MRRPKKTPQKTTKKTPSFSREDVFKSTSLRWEPCTSDCYRVTAISDYRAASPVQRCLGPQKSRPSKKESLSFMSWCISRDLEKSLGHCHPSCALTSCVDAFSSFSHPNPALGPQKVKREQLIPFSTGSLLFQTSPALCSHTIGLY